MNQPPDNATDFNRRDFLKGSSFAALMTMMGGVQLMAQPAPEQKPATPDTGPKVKVAVIGLGVWGREILDQLGRLEKAEVVAICDNYPAMMRRSATKAPLAPREHRAPVPLSGSGGRGLRRTMRQAIPGVRRVS